MITQHCAKRIVERGINIDPEMEVVHLWQFGNQGDFYSYLMNKKVEGSYMVLWMALKLKGSISIYWKE